MLLTRELLKLLLGVTEMSARALLVPEVINLERFGRPRVEAITQVLTEQATDVGSLSLFRLDPSFGRTLYLADLRVVQLGRKLLQALIWVASGVAKTTANLPKHLTWFLASF